MSTNEAADVPLPPAVATIYCTATIPEGRAPISQEVLSRIGELHPESISDIHADDAELTFTITSLPADAPALIKQVARMVPGMPIRWAGSPSRM